MEKSKNTGIVLDKKRRQAIKCQFKKVFDDFNDAHDFIDLSNGRSYARPYRCHICSKIHLTTKRK